MYHQAEEQAGFELRKGQITDLIDDEYLGIGELLQTALQAVLVKGLDQAGHQVFQGQKEHRVACFYGFHAK